MEINPVEQLFIPPKEILSSDALKQRTVDFKTLLSNEIGEVNKLINEAETQVHSLALGEADNLHQVMISLEKAKLSFELLVQIRNKAMEGIQEVLKMSV